MLKIVTDGDLYECTTTLNHIVLKEISLNSISKLLSEVYAE